MKKIIFVLPQLKTGGGVRVIVELANILCKNHQVFIIIPNTKIECTFFIDKKIIIQKVGQTPKNKLTKLLNLIKLPNYLKNNHNDAYIIITDPIQALTFLPYSFKNLFRFIQADDYKIFDDLLLLKNNFNLFIYKTLTKLSYKKNINFFFNSSFSYEMFIKTSKRYDIKKQIVHPSINHDIFYPPKKSKNSEKITIAYIARKHPIKRFDDFINSYNILNKKPNVVIISHDNLSNFEIQNFKLISPKDDKEIADVLRGSDIFVFTSLWEGFGLPPLEAMACGCAIISSDVKGINEYAKNNINALIYPPKNIKELTLRIEELIKNHKKRENLQKEAIKTSKEFSWEKSANKLLELME